MSTFQKVFTTNLNFWPSIWCHFESVLYCNLSSWERYGCLCWEGRVNFQLTSISTGYVRNKIRNDRSEQVCLFSVFQCAAPPRCTRWHPLLFARCLDHQTQWHSAVTALGIFQRSPPRSAGDGDHSGAKPAPAAAVLHIDAAGHYMRGNTGILAIPTLQASPPLQISTFFESLPSWNLYSLHIPTLLHICIKSLHFSTRFTCLLSSCLYSLFVFTSLLSSLLYCLRISTLFTLLLPSHFCPLHTSTFFTSLLSSLLYSLSHLYSLHSSTLFKSLFSSHLYSLHFSIVCTSLLSSHLYSLHASTLFTSLLFSHL